jgi:hypothetical protein
MGQRKATYTQAGFKLVGTVHINVALLCNQTQNIVYLVLQDKAVRTVEIEYTAISDHEKNVNDTITLIRYFNRQCLRRRLEQDAYVISIETRLEPLRGVNALPTWRAGSRSSRKNIP